MPCHKATMLLVLGIVLLLVRLFTNWDMWVVIGALLIIKAIFIYIKICCCKKKEEVKKKK
jgi:hypothetical protein